MLHSNNIVLHAELISERCSITTTLCSGIEFSRELVSTFNDSCLNAFDGFLSFLIDSHTLTFDIDNLIVKLNNGLESRFKCTYILSTVYVFLTLFDSIACSLVHISSNRLSHAVIKALCLYNTFNVLTSILVEIESMECFDNCKYHCRDECRELKEFLLTSSICHCRICCSKLSTNSLFDRSRKGCILFKLLRNCTTEYSCSNLIKAGIFNTFCCREKSCSRIYLKCREE